MRVGPRSAANPRIGIVAVPTRGMRKSLGASRSNRPCVPRESMPELPLGQTAPDDEGGFVTSIGKADAISTSLAARIAGCSHDTMTRWVEEGRVRGWRLSPRGCGKVDPTSLLAYLTRSAHDAAAQKLPPTTLPKDFQWIYRPGDDFPWIIPFLSDGCGDSSH